ncbi:MAG TPA: glycosyltransferase family 4 protein [Phycisphaerae bacterium]|nr:glycosyltransferase family 4 protein [Phycisphaerae bacterium]
MNIALIVEWIDASRGGAETSTIQFVKHLVDLGIDVQVITRSQDTASVPCPVNTVSVLSPAKATATAAFCKEADRVAESLNPDLIHALVPSMVADIYQPRGGTYRETQLRNIATRRSAISRLLKRLMLAMNVKQRQLARLEARMLQRADGPQAIALSDYVVRQLQQHHGLPPERITKIFNGVDPIEFDEATRLAKREAIRLQYGIEDGQYLVLMAANNLRLKGAETWLRALAKIKNSNHSVHSIIAGNGNPTPWLRLASKLGTNDRVTFAGHTDDISAYYHAADVLVHPTFYDPCSRVVLEARSIGLPVITTRYDGAAEVVDPGINGFIIDESSDDDALAAAVCKTLDAIGSGATTRKQPESVAGFTMREHAEAVVRLYEHLLSTRSR